MNEMKRRALVGLARKSLGMTEERSGCCSPRRDAESIPNSQKLDNADHNQGDVPAAAPTVQQ
jgi:hypothetical protein